jgi:hypothetical protein
VGKVIKLEKLFNKYRSFAMIDFTFWIYPTGYKK